MNIYLVMIIGGLIGIILHSLKSVRSINKRIDNATLGFVFKEFWKHDKLALLGSAICFFAMLFIASEFINLNEVDKVDYSEPLKERLLHFRLSAFVKTTSVIAGFFADSIVYGFLGVTEKKIKANLDKQDPDYKP